MWSSDENKKSGFVHSVKVPHLYKVSSKIVRTILQDGGSLKELLYTSVRANLKSAYALITKTIERNTDLDRAIEKSKILVENEKLDPWLAKVLIAELLFGKGKLSSECKPVQTVLSYRQALEAIVESAVELGDPNPVRYVLRYELGMDGFAPTAWAVVASVCVVNLIIVVYAYFAYKEERAELEEQGLSVEDKKDD